MQTGVYRETLTIDGPEISLKDLREKAVKLIEKKYPNNPFGKDLSDHILLYRHDMRSINILQLITTTIELCEGTMVEIVLS
uniref:Serine/threonine-protein kinase D1-3-like ubiquitin-like domain-containing protein n=1 Tax=Romanomermis culicivorax TaxID=13658 RepID=A0A915KID8_ROMCU